MRHFSLKIQSPLRKYSFWKLSLNFCKSFIFNTFKIYKDFNPNINGEFLFQHVTSEYVSALIKDLEAASSTGIVGIPATVMMVIEESISPILSKMFNDCIDNGFIPLEWKCGLTTPLYKNKGDLDE